jgi:hypothetical protein
MTNLTKEYKRTIDELTGALRECSVAIDCYVQHDVETATLSMTSTLFQNLGIAEHKARTVLANAARTTFTGTIDELAERLLQCSLTIEAFTHSLDHDIETQADFMALATTTSSMAIAGGEARRTLTLADAKAGRLRGVELRRAIKLAEEFCHTALANELKRYLVD